MKKEQKKGKKNKKRKNLYIIKPIIGMCSAKVFCQCAGSSHSGGCPPRFVEAAKPAIKLLSGCIVPWCQGLL
jgi:hypothetical protein